MPPNARHGNFEDEEDWIQVADESLDSSMLLESLEISLPERDLNNHDNLLSVHSVSHSDFKVSKNGSFVFSAFARSIQRTGICNTSSSSFIQHSKKLAFEDRFEVLEILGKGSCATVYKVKDTVTDEILAVKKVYIDADKFRRRHFIQELLALHDYRSDGDHNIVKFIDAFAYEGEPACGIIFEYMDGGSLQTIVDKGGVQDEAVLAYIARECLTALEHLHKDRRMMYRDVKPGNILINSKNSVKLADFGLARSINGTAKRASTFVGTLNYMAPERTRGETYDCSSDIFSLGLTLLSTALGTTQTRTGYWAVLSEGIEGVTRCLPDDDDRWSDEFREFISECLQVDPSKRPDTSMLIHHKFIRDGADDGKDRMGTLFHANGDKCV